MSESMVISRQLHHSDGHDSNDENRGQPEGYVAWFWLEGFTVLLEFRFSKTTLGHVANAADKVRIARQALTDAPFQLGQPSQRRVYIRARWTHNARTSRNAIRKIMLRGILMDVTLSFILVFQAVPSVSWSWHATCNPH